MKKWQALFGNFFYLGKSPWFPGTVGSAAGLFLVWVVDAVFGRFSNLTMPVTLGALLFLGVRSSRAYIEQKRDKDPQEVVIDEVVGVFVTFLWMPIHWKSMFFGFIFFRIFDIWKPYPIKQLEKIPGGWGVMLDDVLAGFYANIALRILVRFFW